MMWPTCGRGSVNGTGQVVKPAAMPQATDTFNVTRGYQKLQTAACQAFFNLSNILCFYACARVRVQPSPLLFIMYTDSCRSSQPGNYLAKCPDETALLSLFQGPYCSHDLALTSFVKWCDNNFLDLNVDKQRS